VANYCPEPAINVAVYLWDGNSLPKPPLESMIVAPQGTYKSTLPLAKAIVGDAQKIRGSLPSPVVNYQVGGRMWERIGSKDPEVLTGGRELWIDRWRRVYRRRQLRGCVRRFAIGRERYVASSRRSRRLGQEDTELPADRSNL
jgi:hypothetical protein